MTKIVGKTDFKNLENNVLTELWFCRVLFEVTSSPFLLFAIITHQINKNTIYRW